MTMLISRAGALIGLVAVAAAITLMTTLPSALDAVTAKPIELTALFAVTLLLQTCSVRMPRGSISVSSIGILATAFALGAGPAVLVAVAAAVVQWLRRGGLLHRALFDAANFALSAAIGAGVFSLLANSASRHDVVAATLAGASYCVFNTGLLCIAMGLADGTSPLAVWRERFRWATPHYLVAGPLAFASVLAYDRVGLLGLAVFALPHAAALVAHRRLAVAPSV